MGRRERWLRRVAWTVVVLAVLAGVAVDQAQAFVRRQLPAYLSTRLSQALGRPVTVGSVSFWPLGAFTVRGFRVEALPDEAKPPLVADRVRAYISWWDILIHRRLWVKALHVDQAHVQAVVDLRKPAVTKINAPEKLLSFYRIGLRQVGIHESTVDVTTILKTGEKQPVRAGGLEFVADLRPSSFRYRTGVEQWSAGGLSATGMRIEGTADPERITITKSRAAFQGGTLAANGTYVTDDGDVAMQVTVRDLPLGGLTPQLGVPQGWDFEGKLTGTVDVSARTGALRRVHGTLNVSPGSVVRSRTTLPWTRATARVDWTPAAVSLQGIDVQGQGLRIQGAANVGGSPSARLAARPYRAQGTLDVTEGDAVVRLTRLLAFSSPIPDGWSVDRGTVTFQAKGVVGRMEQSVASGHFQAQGFTIRTTPQGNPLVVRTVEGDLSRTPARLELRGVKATAEGLSAQANATIVPAIPGHPGTFRTEGSVDLTNLQTFRAQLPQATFWQWIDPASPTSRGRITFAAQGPTSNPQAASGTGGFRFHEFAASVPAGAGNAKWNVPVRELTGGMRMADNRLALSDIRLRSDLFTASGSGVLSELSQEARVSGQVRLASSRWQELPPLRGRVPEGLSGGTLAADLRLRDVGVVGSAASPLEGTLYLTGATYRTDVGGQPKTVALEDSTASFRVAGDRLVVPAYKIITPRFRTTGSATGKQQAVAGGSQWLVRATGRLASSNAGALARWWSGREVLQGGALAASYVLDVPSASPDHFALSSRVSVAGGRVLLPEGSLPFSKDETRIRTLTGNVTVREGTVRFADAVWTAPRFRLTGDGSIANERIDGDFRLATSQWREFAPSLVQFMPVEGGTLTVATHLNGPVATLATAPVAGTVEIRGAHLAAEKTRFPVRSGALDLKTEVRGTLEKLVAADLDGTFAVRDLVLPPLRAGVKPLTVETARGRFQRLGTTLKLTDVAAEALGARLDGHGELRNLDSPTPTHAFSMHVQGPSLAEFLPAVAPVPGKARGGRFTGNVDLSGTGAAVVTKAEGKAEVRGGEWFPPGQGTGMKIESMTARFSRNGSVGKLEQAELRVAGGQATLAGTVEGLGSTAGMRHDLRLTWRLEDASGWASRFFPVPGWFTGGLFTGNAAITGTPAQPWKLASGSFEVRDAGFLPPAKFLGGPVKPVGVRWAKGLFNRTGSLTKLTKLDLNTTVGTATGRVTADDRGVAQIRARANIERLEALVDLWPGFQDRLRGGSASMTLALQGPLRRPRELAGTIDLIGKNGVLAVAEVDPLYAEQPFEELSTHIVLSPNGTVELQKVRMRGPRSNLDGGATVLADGRLSAKGKAWFTSRYTKKLFKPKFLYPVAAAVGLGRIKSSYEVHGTLREAKLSLGITKSPVWKVAIRNKIPEDLRKIATGDAPLWTTEGAPATTRVARGR